VIVSKNSCAVKLCQDRVTADAFEQRFGEHGSTKVVESPAAAVPHARLEDGARGRGGSGYPRGDDRAIERPLREGGNGRASGQLLQRGSAARSRRNAAGRQAV